jgi:putative membrane protein
MLNWMHGGTWSGGFGSLVMGLFWVLLILAPALAIAALMRNRPGGTGVAPPRETPLEILQRRYARGEIDQKEYEERRRTLS